MIDSGSRHVVKTAYRDYGTQLQLIRADAVTNADNQMRRTTRSNNYALNQMRSGARNEAYNCKIAHPYSNGY